MSLKDNLAKFTKIGLLGVVGITATVGLAKLREDDVDTLYGEGMPTQTITRDDGVLELGRNVNLRYLGLRGKGSYMTYELLLNYGPNEKDHRHIIQGMNDRKLYAGKEIFEVINVQPEFIRLKPIGSIPPLRGVR